jgi:hypothetical protein
MTGEIRTGEIRVELATAVRYVNAAHARIGGPELPGLRDEWVRLDRSLRLATVAGDTRVARVAVDRYRRNSLAVIEDAAAEGRAA